jgi:hypothetical protein
LFSGGPAGKWILKDIDGQSSSGMPVQFEQYLKDGFEFDRERNRWIRFWEKSPIVCFTDSYSHKSFKRSDRDDVI